MHYQQDGSLYFLWMYFCCITKLSKVSNHWPLRALMALWSFRSCNTNCFLVQQCRWITNPILTPNLWTKVTPMTLFHRFVAHFVCLGKLTGVRFVREIAKAESDSQRARWCFQGPPSEENKELELDLQYDPVLGSASDLENESDVSLFAYQTISAPTRCDRENIKLLGCGIAGRTWTRRHRSWYRSAG